MRTVPFQDVFRAVLRQHGLPYRRVTDLDVSESIVMHINARVEQALLAADWPEWNITEERAFRQIWMPTTQYLRVNANGVPDEVYYLPTQSYYQVLVPNVSNSDPPIGDLPTDLNFWIPLTFTKAYIEYDQVCKRSIGQVLGVYSINPNTTNDCEVPKLRFHPTEHGVDICNPSAPTVFVLFQMPIPTYTMTPFVQGLTYNRGDVVLDVKSGEVFQALVTTQDSPVSFPASWRLVPFLQKWFNFVRFGAYADSLGEVDQGGTFDPMTRAKLKADAEGSALEALQQQIDSLYRQGDKPRWHYRRWRDWSGWWCESIIWTGGTVTTLTSACESDLGWVFPTPAGTVASVSWQYHPEIVSLSSTPPALNAIATRSMALDSVVMIVIDPGTGNERQEWRLVSGAAIPGNPGQLAPQDFDSVSNSKHWERIL